MSHLFGVGLNIEVAKIITLFKMQLQKRGGIGLRALAILLTRADLVGRGALNQDEFERTLGSFNLFPSKVELQALVKAYGTSESVQYDQFLGDLRGKMNKRRQDTVALAFQNCDVDQNGVLSLAEIEAKYDVSFNQDYQEGKMTKAEILKTFLDSFALAGKKVTQITWQQWIDYYADLSLSIVDDNYFVRMLESIWQVYEDGTMTVKKEEVERLTKTIRHKLLDLSVNQSDEYVLRNLFRQLDTNHNCTINADELSIMLSKIQLKISTRYLSALLKKFDRNGSGNVEFEDLVAYLTCNPYK